MVLTLEFRQKLYDKWVKVPRIGTIRKILNDNGVDTRMTGKNSFVFHYQGSSLCGWL